MRMIIVPLLLSLIAGPADADVAKSHVCMFEDWKINNGGEAFYHCANVEDLARLRAEEETVSILVYRLEEADDPVLLFQDFTNVIELSVIDQGYTVGTKFTVTGSQSNNRTFTVTATEFPGNRTILFVAETVILENPTMGMANRGLPVIQSPDLAQQEHTAIEWIARDRTIVGTELVASPEACTDHVTTEKNSAKRTYNRAKPIAACSAGKDVGRHNMAWNDPDRSFLAECASLIRVQLRDDVMPSSGVYATCGAWSASTATCTNTATIVCSGP